MHVCGQVNRAPGNLVLDASQLEFVDPLGLATLGALLEPRASTSRIEMPWLPLRLASYMDRMNFFERCPIEGVEVPEMIRANAGDRLVELRQVTKREQSDQVASDLSRAIAGELTIADESAPRDEHSGQNEFDRYCHPLQYSLSELLLNSLTHARREGRWDASVWVAAQYYPSVGKVRVAIVDNGCGMLAPLRNHPKLGEKTHGAAILAALTPRVSCNREMELAIYGESANEGVGLTTTSRIAKAAKGHLLILSGDGVHFTIGNGRNMTVAEPAGWNGVAISMVCVRNALPSVAIKDLLPAELPADIPHVPVRFVD